MDKQADEVLAELEDLGALGAPPAATVLPIQTSSMLTEVEIEQGPPNVALRDLRGKRTVEAVEQAVAYLDDMAQTLAGLRESLMYLREVWSSVEDTEATSVEPPDASPTLSEDVEAATTPQGASEPSEAPQRDDPAYVDARAAALRKIRGEDTPETQQDIDDAPFVGQDRATLASADAEETTIRTVGTVEPSFPTEESNGT